MKGLESGPVQAFTTKKPLFDIACSGMRWMIVGASLETALPLEGEPLGRPKATNLIASMFSCCIRLFVCVGKTGGVVLFSLV